MLALGSLTTLAARAELPPWVYGERQRQAPVVVDMEVRTVSRGEGDARARCRILRVRRQPGHGQLKAGQFIQVRTPLPPVRPPGWVGPSPLPVPRPGERLTAWLTPVDGVLGTFEPAAGGHSFGPSLEEVRDPN